ncbi:MAG: phage tail sheath family protein [Spirochaetales bacterium]|nr:phage tail sheath family protein [Spirochaetales bacterium]
MTQYNTPGVYYKTINKTRQPLYGTRTDIAGFVGIAEKGLLNTPVRIESRKQFRAIFGNYIPQSYLAYAVNGFFDNGGEACYCIRIADVERAGCASILLFDKRDRCDESLTWHTTLREYTEAHAGELILEDASILEETDYVIIGNDQAYYKITGISGNTVSISSVVARGYAAGTKVTKVIPALEISAVSQGQWGKKIKVRLEESDAGTTVSSGFQASCEFTTVKSIKDFESGVPVKVWQKKDDGTILNAYHYVESVNPVSKKISWATPLAGFDLRALIYLSIIGFTLVVTYEDREREVFKNLSLNETHRSGFIENVINGKSNLITIRKVNSLTPIPWNLPDPLKLSSGYVYLKGGCDGISTISIKDFIGDPLLDEKKGLLCYEDVQDISIICMPDLFIQPVDVTLYTDYEKPDPCTSREDITTPVFTTENPPVFSDGEIERAVNSMIDHAERLKDRIVIIDPPPGLDILEIYEWRQKFESTYAALYYPWIKVNDPLLINGNITRDIPPSGYIAGVFARTDMSKGVHKAPANENMKGVRDTLVNITDHEQEILNPAGVNCIREFPGKGFLLWGARTISRNPAWRFINIRRLFIMIEESLDQALQWAVFEVNNAELKNGIILVVSGFLESLWRRGALAGSTPAEAFYVKCDNENNPLYFTDQGKLITDIGVAPSIPAEYILLQIGKIKDKLEIKEQGTDYE